MALSCNYGLNSVGFERIAAPPSSSERRRCAKLCPRRLSHSLWPNIAVLSLLLLLLWISSFGRHRATTMADWAIEAIVRADYDRCPTTRGLAKELYSSQFSLRVQQRKLERERAASLSVSGNAARDHDNQANGFGKPNPKRRRLSSSLRIGGSTGDDRWTNTKIESWTSVTSASGTYLSFRHRCWRPAEPI